MPETKMFTAVIFNFILACILYEHLDYLSIPLLYTLNHLNTHTILILKHISSIISKSTIQYENCEI